MKSIALSLSLIFFAAGSPVDASTMSVAPKRPAGYAMGKGHFESSAIVEVVFPRREVNAPQKPGPGPEFMEKQREEILSDENLREAIQELMPGAVGDQAAFFEQVKKEIKVENIRGTDLLRIAVISGDKRFSRDLANRLAERYLKNHKPEEVGKEPIIHQKAEIGKPVEKKKKEVEQDAP